MVMAYLNVTTIIIDQNTRAGSDVAKDDADGAYGKLANRTLGMAVLTLERVGILRDIIFSLRRGHYFPPAILPACSIISLERAAGDSML
jgi:hypothetical protein